MPIALPQIIFPTPRTITRSAFTLTNDHHCMSFRMNSAAQQIVTVPAGLRPDFRAEFIQVGAGETRFDLSAVTNALPIGIPPNVFMGALAKKAADQNGADYTTITQVTWDGDDIYDTHGFHNPASNSQLMTIPANYGIKKISGASSFRLESSSPSITAWCDFLRNDGGGQSSAFPGTNGNTRDVGSFTSCLPGAVLPVPFPVADGYTLAARLQVTTDVSLNLIAASSSFGIKVEEINPVGIIAKQGGAVNLIHLGDNAYTMTGCFG